MVIKHFFLHYPKLPNYNFSSPADLDGFTTHEIYELSEHLVEEREAVIESLKKT